MLVVGRVIPVLYGHVYPLQSPLTTTGVLGTLMILVVPHGSEYMYHIQQRITIPVTSVVFDTHVRQEFLTFPAESTRRACPMGIHGIKGNLRKPSSCCNITGYIYNIITRGGLRVSRPATDEKSFSLLFHSIRLAFLCLILSYL